MKRQTNHVFVLSLFILVFILICPAHGSGTSTDILIEKNGTVMSWTDAHIDNNLVATYVSTDSPPAIRVYFMNETLYKSVPLSSNNVDLDSLAFSDGRIYFTEHNRDDVIYRQNETVCTGPPLQPGRERNCIPALTANVLRRSPPAGIMSCCAEVLLSGALSCIRSRSVPAKSFSHPTTGLLMSILMAIMSCGDVSGWTRGPGGRSMCTRSPRDQILLSRRADRQRPSGIGDISGENVAWVMSAKDRNINDVPGGISYDMELTNIVSGKTESVERSDTAPVTVPFISGDTIVWVKKPNVDYNNYYSDTGIIRTYNITTGTFGDIAANVSAISDFDNGVVLWSRLDSVSFWVTPLSGKIPEGAIATSAPAAGFATTIVPQHAASQKSPVDPGLIIAVPAAGGTGYALLHRRQ